LVTNHHSMRARRLSSHSRMHSSGASAPAGHGTFWGSSTTSDAGARVGPMMERKGASSSVIVPDPKSLARKRAALVGGGAEQLQVIADFDRTITRASVNGARGASCHGVMESLECLSAEYREEAKLLFDKYYPLEICEHMTTAQKLPLMMEWYEQGHDLLLREGVAKHHIQAAVAQANLALREGVCPIIHTLQAAQVPLLIFSAGIANVIDEVMRQKFGELTESTHIISNWMQYNSEDVCVGFSTPLIHMFNKNESQTTGSAFAATVAQRGNVLLMGDGLGDVTMADGIPHNTVLKVGFLNEKVDELLPKYCEIYDVIITHDGDMEYVVDLIQEVCGTRNQQTHASSNIAVSGSKSNVVGRTE